MRQHPYLCKMTVKNDVSLKPYNTFGIDVKARYLIEINTVDELNEAVDFKNRNKLPFLILGGGSNVLFTKTFEGVVFLNRIEGLRVVEEDDEQVLLKVAGGMAWPRFVDYCVEKNLGGIENLSLIPGTVGAAPIQNIGAYGTEVKETVVEVEAVDLTTGKIKTFSNEACRFGYRSSVFKTRSNRNYFITAVTFELKKNPVVNLSYAPLKHIFQNRDINTVSIAEVGNAVKQIRRSKLPDPDQIGNSGSFFKNPVVGINELEALKKRYPEIPYFQVDRNSYKLAAGWMIEQCGRKGKRLGDAGVHDKQALVLVNHGNATGSDILDLAMMIKKSVNEKFGIELEFEVNIY